MKKGGRVKSLRQLVVVGLALLIWLVAPGWAQLLPEPDGETPTPVSVEAVATPEVGKTSPRDAVADFLNIMREAGPLRPDLYLAARKYLDLSGVPSVVRDEKSVTLANDLYNVLMAADVDMASIPDTDPGLDRVRVYRQPTGDEIYLVRADDGSWQFSADSLAGLNRMYGVLATKGKLASFEVPAWLDFRFLGLAGLQWLLLICIPFLSWFFGRVCVLVVRRLVKKRLEGESFGISPDEQKKVLRPLGWLIGSLMAWVGFSALMLPEAVLVLLAILCKFVATSAAVLSAYRFCDVLAIFLHHLATRTESTFDDMLVPLVRRSLKVVITILGLLFIAQNLDLEVWSLFAGFSVVGAMVALAGQDMVKNFFGSLTVLMDRPFSVGDWVVVEGVEGVVEDVGFRSTRIRTFYDSVISLPNSRLITAHVDNYGARTYRRYTTKLNLLYSTAPDRLEAFCEGIRELVRVHPHTRKDSFQVWVNDMSDYSLQVLLYVFWKCADWESELRERHRFLVDVHRLARTLELEFAYPTSTVHLDRESPELGSSEFTRESEELAREQGRELVATLTAASLPETTA